MAIDHAGQFDEYATPQLRRWQIVPETQSFREMWASGDLSHGWCSTPLVQMSQRVLGVEPTSPGFKTMAIHPHVCDLTWARGKVPTPHGDVEISWNWKNDRIFLDATIPEGTEADVIVPDKTVHLNAGRHHFESAYNLAPKAANPDTSRLDDRETPVPTNAKDVEIDSKLTDDSPAGLEADLVRTGLVSIASTSEENVAHEGGGTDASALFNSTTKNGSGDDETLDDGKTFRGYGAGSSLTIRFKQPADISRIATFAGHGDARASQSYTLFIAYAGALTTFLKLTHAAVPCDGGASELKINLAAKSVVGLRFDFEDGPLGFNVYREINLIGKETAQ